MSRSPFNPLRYPSAVAAIAFVTSCGDAIAPEHQGPTRPAFLAVGTQAAIEGNGILGPGAATPGSDLQEFDFAVAADLRGGLTYRDWMVNALLTVDPADPDTRITAFRAGAGECAEFVHGAAFDGIGRLGTGELVSFSLTACDDGAAGSGLDRLQLTAAAYSNADLLSGGDIVKTVTDPSSSQHIRVIGSGFIGSGAAVPRQERVEFDFDVTSELSGRLTATDYEIVRDDGSPALMIVDPAADPGTGFTTFNRSSAACVTFEGVGRINDGNRLVRFVVDACDNASPGAGFDTLGVVLPDRPYSTGGTVTGGDIAISSADTSAGTTVVASAYQSPNVPQNTLDNDLGTRWSAEGDGQWIQYDLGAPRDIGGMDIAWYNGNLWESAFELEVSSDGLKWTRVFAGRSSGQTVESERYDFSAVRCRYVRIIGHSQWNGTRWSSWWNSITEADIRPGSGASTCPEPADNGLPVVSVTASGYQSPNAPANTLDKSLGTRWSAEGDGQWIQYDLGAPKSVSRVDIAWYRGNEWESQFEIHVSQDAATWWPVFSGRSSGQTVQPEGYAFPTATARYVRIIGHGQWNGTALSSWWNSITELDIPNVLPAAAVAASGYQSPNVPENTLDNNLGTRWSAEGDGQWIQYDLGAPTAVAGVDIAWYNGNLWESEFAIEVSSDGVTWARVFAGRGSGQTVQFERYEFSAVTCRYVRIIGHGQWNGGTLSSWWNSLTEVDIRQGSAAGT